MKKINGWTREIEWFTNTWIVVHRKVRVAAGKSPNKKPTKRLIERVTEKISRLIRTEEVYK
jgi:hypothetical protein